MLHVAPNSSSLIFLGVPGISLYPSNWRKVYLVIRAPSIAAACFARTERSCTLLRVVLIAITRAASPAIANCELTFVSRNPIDLAKAQVQHRAYETLLAELGAEVISLPAEPALPDSIFVEDPAIVFDELAVICSLGTESRRAESASLARVLQRFRVLAEIALPATLEGGDVLRVGRKVYAGSSTRTNTEGIRQLAAILAPHHYEVIEIPVSGCLHLKSAVTFLGGNTLLANRNWFDAAVMPGYDWIDVDSSEPHAANALAVGGTIVFPASFPKTCARVEERGFSLTSIDISELQKAESGLTCSSLLFDVPRM
jgi:dimethylargininase